MAGKLTAKDDALLRIEYILLDNIARFDKNPKKHDVGALVTSIRRYGFRDAPIFDGTLKALVAGHGRLKALEAIRGEGGAPPAGIKAAEGGQWLVPVQLGIDAKSASEAKAFLIDHNTLTLSGGDLGVDSMLRLYDQSGLEELLKESGPTVSFDGEDIDELINGKKEVVEDDPSALIDAAKELEKKWGTKLGQLWLLGEHRVLCGDSTKAEDVGRVMGEEKADCVFTSPPYAVGIDYGIYKDTIANLREMLPKLSARWNESIRDGGYAVVNFGDIVSAREIAGSDEPCEYPMALEYWPIFRADKWVLWSRRAWCKPAAGTGSMQCISSNRASTNWENIWTWKRPGKALHNSQTTGEYPSQNGWIDSTHGHKLGVGLKDHGAGMPVMIAAYGIAVHALDGGIVLEPFMGTGTTLIAADQLKRKCYGLEISPQYVAVILERWSKLTGGEPKLDG